MATCKLDEAQANIKKKGFRVDREQHHEQSHDYYRLYIGDEPTDIETHFSRPNRDIYDMELRAMKRQVKLNSRNELLDLFKCPMSHERYLEVLRERGHI